MNGPTEDKRIPTILSILIGLLLFVITEGVALILGDWDLAIMGLFGFASWVIATTIADVIDHRKRP